MSQPPAEPDDGASLAVRVLTHGPPLMLIAVVAAVVEMILARVLWHGLPDVIDPSDLFEIRRLARFPRNLAAVAGLLSLTIALLGFLRFPGYAPIGRRLAVAAFSGIFIPSVVVSALLRPEMLRQKLVVFALAAANVLVTLFGMTAVRYRADRPLRIAVALAGATSFLTLLFVGIGQLTQAEGGIWEGLNTFLTARYSGVETILLGIRHTGELCWIGVIALGCFTAAYDRGAPGLPLRAGIAVALSAAFAIGILLLQDLFGHRFRYAVFGAFRLGLAIDDAPGVYALPLAVGLAGACVAIARRDPALRQLGGGLFLWIAGGFAPHTPIQLLYFVLGAMLITRAAQARDPQGAWRKRQPWARFSGMRVSAPPPEKAINPQPSPRPEG